MKRRQFITLLGGAAAWPLAARAQERERTRRIGVLMNMAASDPESQARLSALVRGLQELGWTVGRNVRIDYRWGEGDTERYRRQAAEMLALEPDVIVSWGEGDTERYRRQAAEMLALEPDVIVSWGAEIASGSQKASRAVPIVFAQSIDPVGSGMVASLARPGGNATGFTQFEYSLSRKWVELLKQ